MTQTAFRNIMLTLLSMVCAGIISAQTSPQGPSLPEGAPEDVDSVTTVTTVTTVTRTTWYRAKTDSVAPLHVVEESPYIDPDVAPSPMVHYIDTVNGYPVNELGKIVITTINPELLNERVVVGNDTIPIILPSHNYGRYDRGLFNFLFVPRGQWLFGLNASYGEFNSEDVQILSLLKDFSFKGKMYSVSPTVGYFFRNNQVMGMKFVYSRGIADLGSLAVDFDDDMNFTLSDISYYSQKYTASVFYRNYVGLGADKRFAIFNEVDLAFGSGSSRFKRSYDGELRDTKTMTSEWSLNFSPGVTMFIMDNVCFNISFGVFGIHYTHDRQYTNGVNEGSRVSSGANFKFNIFNINFGLGVCI